MLKEKNVCYKNNSVIFSHVVNAKNLHTVPVCWLAKQNKEYFYSKATPTSVWYAIAASRAARAF